MNPAEFPTLRRAERELWWFRGMRKILFGILDRIAMLKPGQRVFEGGSGTGYMASAITERYGCRMVAADIAWEGVASCPKETRVPTVQANLNACPFETAAFDAVVSLDVLVHFDRGDEQGPLAEFARVAKPGALLVIRVAALDVLRSRHSAFTDERQRYTKTSLIRAARRAGFRPVRCTYANSLLMPVALAKFRLWEPLSGAPVTSGTAMVAPWLNKMLELALSLEAWLLSRGWNLPAGQSLVLIAVRE
jgi:SAM-dependent methyltransferase